MEHTAYRVLARKYRPSKFSELIGQDTLVRIISNAIENNRVSHAFMLTGIRGTGKTTTARIIARALNCIGQDGKGKPNPEPCGVCEHCIAIAEDRHVDVLEIDAASRTGVSDIREIIDGVQYQPVTARYKIYIIDEVHMLSKSAFNALLKTLEEPPPHVKFIFATTELRKIPVTILSRCQRYDLARVEKSLLAENLKRIAEKEGIAVESEAISLIANVSEGSVRDSLSLFDQAIAQSLNESLKEVKAEQVKAMLGLSDRSHILDLFENIIKGEAKEAFLLLRKMYQSGGDPVSILEDLLELTHQITELKLVPTNMDAPEFQGFSSEKLENFSKNLKIPVLSRLWQMLLKGIGEVRISSDTLMAAEMVIVRIAYASDLPTPEKLIRDIESGTKESVKPQVKQESSTIVSFQSAKALSPAPQNFEELVNLFCDKGELILSSWFTHDVRPIHVEPGIFKFQPKESVSQEITRKVIRLLNEWTGINWRLEQEGQGGAETLAEIQKKTLDLEFESVKNDALVKAVLDVFPDAVISRVENIKKEEDKKEAV